MVDSTTDATGSDAAEPFRVRSIVVRESAMSSGHPYDLVSDVVDFVNFCAAQAAIAPEEMPQNAMRSYYTDYYHAQVNNGGHGQFVGNSNWTESFNTYIQEGLKAFGDEKFCAIFEDLCTLMESDPERAQIIMDGRGFGDIPPEVQALDSRFFALEPDENLLPAHADWLRELPELHPVGDQDYENVLRGLAHSNPNFSKRKRAAKRQAITATTKDPLLTTAKLLCQRAGLTAPMQMGAGKPGSTAPDGREGTAWQFVNETEVYEVFLFDDVAILCEAYLGDGRRLTRELRATPRENLFDLESDEAVAWANMEYRELARLPMDVTSEALGQADSQPLLQLADILLRKAPIKGEITDIVALMNKDRNGIVWGVQVEDYPPLYMTVHPNPTRLYDREARKLIDLTVDEIEYASVQADVQQQLWAGSVEPVLGMPDETFVKFLVSWASLFALSGAVAASLIATFFLTDISATALGVVSALPACYIAVRLYRIYRKSKIAMKWANEFSDLAWLKQQISPKMVAEHSGAGALAMLTFACVIYGADYLLKVALQSTELVGHVSATSVLVAVAGLCFSVAKFDAWLHHWAQQKVKERPR